MEELAKPKNLILTKSDKGGAVVIIDTDSYIKEANHRQLSDKASYKQLSQDQTLQQNRMFNQTIEKFKNEKLLPKKTADGLKVSNPKIPKLYILPKINTPNNPGRPVTNSIECHTENSSFINHHLQPVVKQIPSYIKDTNHFINKVNNFSVPVNSILVTMHVRSIYTILPNSKGIAATKKRYSYSHKALPTKISSTFLELTFTLNNFVFNSKFYL